MSKWQISLFLPILTIIFISACTNPNLTQSQGGSSSSPAQTNQMTSTMTIPDNASLSIVEVVDIEAQFIAAYQTGELADMMEKDLDVADIKVKFQSWSPDGEQMLLRVKTGEVLRGYLPNSLPGMGVAIIGITDLWLADSQGLPVSLLAKSVTWPVWSPRGDRVAYIHEFVEDNFIVGELWVGQVDGTDHKKVFSGAFNVAWLDNNTIMFIETDTQQFHLFDLDSQQVNPLSITGLTAKNADAQVVLYNLSPNKQKLAFLVRGDNKIWIATFNNNQAEIVTEIEIPDLSRLNWSPDNNYLAFTPRCSKPQHNPACQKIYIVEVDGTIVTEINHRPQTNITWSSDGQWLAFQENNKVYLANTTSGQVELLHTFLSNNQNTTQTVFWHPTEAKIGLNQSSDSGATLLFVEFLK